MENNISLLDCTLRDGGYINNWKFGFHTARQICEELVKARIDSVEVGFLRDCTYDKDTMLFNTLEELKGILPEQRGSSHFTAMALNGTYDIKKLVDYDGTTVDSVRLAFHPYDVAEGIEFCRIVKEKGYRSYCQPINMKGYSDYELLKILEQVNKIQPYAFAIVDTFGSMVREDLRRIYSLVHHNLNPDIVLGIHLHENFGLAFSLAQEFLDLGSSTRQLNIDASLCGMGRVPGNLCIELIADYINNQIGDRYDLDPLLDAIDNHILIIKEKEPWGYSPPYMLSAKYNLHRNYAEYLVQKGLLNAKDINHILRQIPEDKKAVYDKKYVEQLFNAYQNQIVDDKEAMATLGSIFAGRPVLVLAPGATLNSHREEILTYINSNNPVVICANFNGQAIVLPFDYSFYTNTKRYDISKIENQKSIITSNLLHKGGDSELVLNYNRLATSEPLGDNCIIMLIQLLTQLHVDKLAVAGLDGYVNTGDNYCDTLYSNSYSEHDSSFNSEMSAAIKRATNALSIHFVTPSHYDEGRTYGTL